jgi:hypothetical protein
VSAVAVAEGVEGLQAILGSRAEMSLPSGIVQIAFLLGAASVVNLVDDLGMPIRDVLHTHTSP